MPTEPPYAECPACASVFRVPAALSAPRVRCGVCGAAFELAPVRTDDPWAVRPRIEGIVGAEGAVVPPPSAPLGPTPRPAIPLRANAPVELPPAGPSLKRVLALALLTTALVAALIGQLLWFGRDALAASAGLRPLATRFCAAAGCTLPPWRELDAWTLSGARIASHPRRRDALVAEVTLVNEARLAQPLPTLVLQLLDGRGAVIAARAFTPAQYLPAGQPDAAVPSGARVPVHLALADVAGAQDFSFALHW